MLFHLRHHGLFLAGDDQPQTNQPYGQAGGQPYLVNFV